MTIPARINESALRWRKGICATAAGILCAASQAAFAQVLVNLSRGESAVILPGGRTYRLGEPWPATGRPNEILLEGAAGSPINRICCPATIGSRQSQCITERQVSLGASRAEVLGRYGPPESQEPTTLRYAGVAFELDPQLRVVARICIQRR